MRLARGADRPDDAVVLEGIRNQHVARSNATVPSGSGRDEIYRAWGTRVARGSGREPQNRRISDSRLRSQRH
jgi:hypothetical protein